MRGLILFYPGLIFLSLALQFQNSKKILIAPEKLDIRVQIDWCNCYQTKNEEMSYQNADHLKIMNERFSQELDEVQI